MGRKKRNRGAYLTTQFFDDLNLGRKIAIHNISSETLVRDLDDHVRRFWGLETIGIKTMQDKGMAIHNSEILSDFHNSFCKVDGRRVVKLPWKPELICTLISYPTAAKHLENNIFMDDFVMGVDTAEQATTLYQEMQDLMTQISLPLAKWSTTPKPTAIWELKDIIFKCNTQVLGINWNTKEDVFHTDINESVYQFAVPATNRLLLKIVSKLYDPLGLYAPAIVIGKILFQTTWLMGVQ
ncbi:hypothetical protein HNY73_005913 [Argiope bruennichi]|uniref:Reverse transcriptase domain-containing protein n=1 Tax=Argiope bruennichi TaxID=94029 RepID=A0A8T0FKS8_ARGBR|nr:hypothetical protein HNY73_005913 [Argiope bruennichi]